MAAPILLDVDLLLSPIYNICIEVNHELDGSNRYSSEIFAEEFPNNEQDPNQKVLNDSWDVFFSSRVSLIYQSVDQDQRPFYKAKLFSQVLAEETGQGTEATEALIKSAESAVAAVACGVHKYATEFMVITAWYDGVYRVCLFELSQLEPIARAEGLDHAEAVARLSLNLLTGE